jgi:putative PIN family toxin of toxin-antitoxin system
VSVPPARRAKAVVDTNVLLRGLTRTKGPSQRLLRTLTDYDAFELVRSNSILAEIEEVLRRPSFRKRVTVDDAQIQTALRGLRGIAELVPGNYVDLDAVPTDADDNHVVATGLEGGADYLVTEDRRDLLPLKVKLVSGYQPLQIVSVRDFLNLLPSP